MQVIYVAGSYGATSNWGRHQNIEHAKTVARHLWQIGWAVICPHANTAEFDGEDDRSIWIEGDLEILRRCDAIMMLENWSESEGAKKELELAESLGLQVYHE